MKPTTTGDTLIVAAHSIHKSIMLNERAYPVTARLRASRRRSIRFFKLGLLLIVGFLGIGISTWQWLRNVGVIGSYDQRAVRAWLQENLHTPEWEEVRWWNPISVSDNDFAPLNDLVIEVASGRKPKKAPPTNRLIRLKFRAKNEVGATQLYDFVLLISGQSATPLDDTTKRVILSGGHFSD